ncbi:MAG: ACT domain-containing protein [Armatimonadota bacterium]
MTMYNEVSIFVENRPGQLSKISELLGNAGIDILAIDVADEGQFGIIKILTAEPDKAKDVLSAANMAVAFNKVACIDLEDRPGGLVKLTKALESAKLNITDAYGCILERGKRAVFVVKGDNLDAIEAAAAKAGLRVLEGLE